MQVFSQKIRKNAANAGELCNLSSLGEDGQIVVGQLKDDAGNRRAKFRADVGIDPRSVRTLIPEQRVSNGREPFSPVVSTRVPRRLSSVVLAVEVVTAADRPGWEGSHHMLQGFVDFRSFVNAGTVQCYNSGSSQRKTSAAGRQRVTEAPIGILTFLDILDAKRSRSLGHFDACISRRSQRHDLTDGDGKIRIAFPVSHSPGRKSEDNGIG